MRCSELGTLVVSAAALAACSLPLHEDGDAGAVAGSGVSPPPAVLGGCRLFADGGKVDGLAGGLRSIAAPDGGALMIADDARVAGVDVPALGIAIPPGASIADCFGSASFAGGSPTSLLEPAGLVPLALLGEGWLFYDSPFQGTGVAQLDAPSGKFVGGGLLWTADRPGFGTAAAEVDSGVFVYGCKGARFLDADCYLASVASPANLADESAYTYDTGGGHGSPRVDDAWPVTSASTSIDVAWIAAQNRWLMAYVPPLGTTIRARSGLAPHGPWSAALDLATCDAPASDMFCDTVHLHPALTATPGTIVLSYAINSLSADKDARRAADPGAWWPRLVELPLPALP